MQTRQPRRGTLAGGMACCVVGSACACLCGPLRSISPDAVLRKTKATLAAAGEVFHAHGTVALKPGFTSIMPWKVRGARACAPRRSTAGVRVAAAAAPPLPQRAAPGAVPAGVATLSSEAPPRWWARAIARVVARLVARMPAATRASLQAVQNEPLPALAQGEQLDMKEVELHQVRRHHRRRRPPNTCGAASTTPTPTKHLAQLPRGVLAHAVRTRARRARRRRPTS